MGPGARVGPTCPRLLPARAGAPPWSRPSVRLARLAADGAWVAARGALSLRASGGVGAAAGPRRVPDCDRAGAKRRRHHVLPEAAQTHLQVLPPAAAPGKHPLPHEGPCPGRFRGAAGRARGSRELHKATLVVLSPAARVPELGRGETRFPESPHWVGGNL